MEIEAGSRELEEGNMKATMLSAYHLMLRYMFAGIVTLAIAGCNFPVRRTISANSPSATAATQDGELPPIGFQEATNTSAPLDINGTAEPIELTTETATIVHVATPGEPGATASYVEDYSSKSTAAEKRAPGGDSFTYNLYERPFYAKEMSYVPGIDIVRADLARDTAWFYVSLRLQEAPSGSAAASARYAVEVDADIDGRGDFLIGTAMPTGTEWTPDGVQIWEDSNGDVGGPIPVKSDPPGARDGYDELTFDQGIGVDPDAAWARISPSDPKYVQIAFKRTAIGSDSEFLWGVWADAGVQHPGWFDYDDHFTFAEAGSPLAAKAEYPLKAMEAVDNTCRMSYGFTLLGTEPGACYVAKPTATPTVTPTATKKIFIPHKTPLVPMPGFTVTSVVVRAGSATYSGTCPLNIWFYANITTNGAGTVQARWENPDGGYWGEITEIFTAAGTHEISYPIRVTVSIVENVRLHILSPNDMFSNTATSTITCW